MSRQPNKRSLTLDLNSPSATSKKARAAQQLLTSPDVQRLKLTTPELADFLTRNPTLSTPTPSGSLFPQTVTEEQRIYAKGFEEALKNMHQSEPKVEPHQLPQNQQQQPIITITTTSNNTTTVSTNPQPEVPASINVSRPSSGASGSIDSDTYTLPDNVQVKEEPRDSDSPAMSTSSVSGVSPIDMESQEKIKLERKRMRNRLAASKCRKRKLERISLLDDKVQVLKGENAELASVVKKLKESVCMLKQEVIEHVNNGCQIMLSDSTAFS